MDQFWWGVLAGVIGAFLGSFALFMLVLRHAIHHAPMADERTWTGTIHALRKDDR